MEENVTVDSGGVALHRYKYVVVDQEVKDLLETFPPEVEQSVNKNVEVKEVVEQSVLMSMLTSKESEDSSASAVPETLPLQTVNKEAEAQSDEISQSPDGDLQSANISTTCQEQRTSKRLATKSVPKDEANSSESTSCAKPFRRKVVGLLPDAITEPPWKSGTPRFTYTRKPSSQAPNIVRRPTTSILEEIRGIQHPPRFTYGRKSSPKAPNTVRKPTTSILEESRPDNVDLDVCMYPNAMFVNLADNSEELLIPDNISSPHDDNDTELVKETKEVVLDCNIPSGSGSSVAEPLVTVKKEVDEVLDNCTPSTSKSNSSVPKIFPEEVLTSDNNSGLHNINDTEMVEEKKDNSVPLGTTDSVPLVTIKKEIIEEICEVLDDGVPSTSKSSIPGTYSEELLLPDNNPSPSHDISDTEMVEETKESILDCDLPLVASDAEVSIKDDESDEGVVEAIKEEFCEVLLKNDSPTPSTRRTWNTDEPRLQCNLDKDNNEIDAGGTTEIQHRRKREETWNMKITVNRLNRNSGKSYVSTSGKQVPGKTFFNKNCNCSKKCFEKISEPTRKIIFDAFWKIGNYSQQNFYLYGLIKRFHIKERRPRERSKHPKEYTFKYFLNVGEQNLSVCKSYFLQTFAVSNGRLMRTLKRAPGVDLRGKIRAVNKTSVEMENSALSHILSFPSYPSLRTQRKNENFRYLSSNLNVCKMYRFYLEYCEEINIVPVKENIYRKIFKSQNLRFMFR